MRAPDFWQGDGAAARLLDPIGKLYGLAGNVRRQLTTPRRAGVPVICIGNLTVGGAGKTPAAIAVARRLQADGAEPHLLTRGYGGRERGPFRVDPGSHDAASVGDEPLLLARIAPTWVSADRVAGAHAAVAAGASHIVMDDGLQNPHLIKDLSLLVIDGAVGFGNLRVLPAGPLREPVEPALSRVDAVIVIGEDQTDIRALLPQGLTVLPASIEPSDLCDHLRGRRVFAFAGIGRPTKFFETLEGLGAVLVATRAFPDHHRYRPGEIDGLLRQARQFDAACITTEKDHVRLPKNLENAVENLPISLEFQESDRLDQLLKAASTGHAADAK